MNAKVRGELLNVLRVRFEKHAARHEGLAWEAIQARLENAPGAEIGIEILDEERYRRLQRLGEFDRKTSSWIATPADVRALGGALFCDRRYGKVFVYHNGAESYYAARGFRGLLRV